jgi:hypothetical protein
MMAEAPSPTPPPGGAAAGPGAPSAERGRRTVPLRLDPAVHEALTRWSANELRSLNAQIDLILREALRRAGRLPPDLRPARRPGRPRNPGPDPDPASEPPTPGRA